MLLKLCATDVISSTVVGRWVGRGGEWVHPKRVESWPWLALGRPFWLRKQSFCLVGLPFLALTFFWGKCG